MHWCTEIYEETSTRNVCPYDSKWPMQLGPVSPILTREWNWDCSQVTLWKCCTWVKTAKNTTVNKSAGKIRFLTGTETSFMLLLGLLVMYQNRKTSISFDWLGGGAKFNQQGFEALHSLRKDTNSWLECPAPAAGPFPQLLSSLVQQKESWDICITSVWMEEHDWTSHDSCDLGTVCSFPSAHEWFECFPIPSERDVFSTVFWLTSQGFDLLEESKRKRNRSLNLKPDTNLQTHSTETSLQLLELPSHTGCWHTECVATHSFLKLKLFNFFCIWTQGLHANSVVKLRNDALWVYKQHCIATQRHWKMLSMRLVCQLPYRFSRLIRICFLQLIPPVV